MDGEIGTFHDNKVILDNNVIPDNISILDKLSDVTRFVDPIQKKVIEYKNNSIVIDKFNCFDFWGKNKACGNCISMRAYNDNATFVKIEYSKDRIYMIIAVPYELGDRRIVMEILKDTTNSMIFGAEQGGGVEATGIHALIDNMNNLAYKDALTGLYNRRYISEKLPVDLLNSSLSSRNMSLIMADIDFFKKVNDTYGHLAGDHALQSFSETISGCMKRSSDWISRFGGEEFLICMPGANLDLAVSTAELMRKAVEKMKLRFADQEFSVTASFGVYSVTPDASEGVDELLKHVDEKLYLAKKNGRNRTEY